MQTLGLFVKHPAPGRVKTRLAATLGNDASARLYAAFVTDLIERFRAFPVSRCLGFTPDDAKAQRYFQSLAGRDYQLWPQPDEDLGRRMFTFFQERLRTIGDRAVLIGSDSPSLPSQLVADAFQALDQADIVLGPAADGGYYLVGMNHPVKEIFDEISWSEPTVLLRTLDRIAARHWKLALLPVWYDVDSCADLGMLRGHLAAMTLAGTDPICPATRQVLEEMASGRQDPGVADAGLGARRFDGIKKANGLK